MFPAITPSHGGETPSLAVAITTAIIIGGDGLLYAIALTPITASIAQNRSAPMALVEVSFVSPMGIGPVDNSTFSTAEIITSSAANQVSAGACQNIGQVCVIATTAGAVYAAIGATPDATVAGTRRLIPDGTVRTFWLNVIGHKVAIVNAP